MTNIGHKWPKEAINGQKNSHRWPTWGQNGTNNQVGQRIGHTQMPKNPIFVNLMPTFNGTPANLISIPKKT